MNLISSKINFFKKDVERILKKKNVKIWLGKLSKHLNIEEKEIVFFFEKKYIENINLRDMVKKKKICLPLAAIHGLLFIPYIFLIFILKGTKEKFHKYYILIDNMNSQIELDRYRKLINLSKHSILARGVNVKSNNLKGCNIVYEKRFFNYILEIKDFKFLLINFFYLSYFSFKFKINFFYLFLHLIDDFYYFQSFFRKYRCKFMISHQHYHTNNIKNIISKQYGTISCVLQKNIDTSNLIGHFYHADIAFTFGFKVGLEMNARYSKIKKKVPMGSFFMEHYLYKKKISLNGYKKFDILCIGGNQLHPGGFLDISKYNAQDYTEHLDWLIKISDEFPNLRIGFKHHNNNSKNFEKNYLIN